MASKAMTPDVIRTYQGSAWTGLFRLRTPDRELAESDTITSIAWRVTAQADGSHTEGEVDLDTVSEDGAYATIYDELETDWEADATGYNVALTLPASAFTKLGFVRAKLTITSTAGIFIVVLRGEVISA